MSKKETEAFLKKNIYGKWYDYDTGKEHVIDEISRDGYLYGIYAASRDYTINFYYIYYYYPNDPDRIYCELWHVSNLVTEGGGIAQPELGGYKKKGFHSEDHYYGRMSEQEINDYLLSLPE